MAQPEEIELKLDVPSDQVDRLDRLPLLRHNKPDKSTTLVSVYFDTAKQKLRRNGFSLRVRHANGHYVQTVKKRGGHSVGLFERNEWECEVADGRPDLDAALDTPLAPLLNKKLRPCSPTLRDLVVRYTEALWSEAQRNAACNAIHDGSSRLCRWLLQCVDRTGSDQLPLTQESLAEMLGMRRTTVTLLAQQLQNRGILRYSRGRITVLDRALFQRHACGCYAAIKDDYLPHDAN
jgi:Crp-like helix-turn-helix domain/CYTH domain